MEPTKRAGAIDPGQQAVGLRPTHGRRVDHPLDAGPPFFPAVTPAAPAQLTEVAIVTALKTVVQVSEGVAIFGTGRGLAVSP